MSESLNEILGLKGMCIYGSPENRDDSDSEKKAYQNGSFDAFNECAALADKIKHEINVEIISRLRKASFGQTITLNIAINEVNRVLQSED